MDETIRVRAVRRNDWDSLIKGFALDMLQQVLEIYDSNGNRVGIICESQAGEAFINGQPQMAYASLQVAATALMKSLRK